MIKHQFFVNKHLPVQTQGIINSNKRYSICLNLLIKIPLYTIKNNTVPCQTISWEFSEIYKSTIS